MHVAYEHYYFEIIKISGDSIFASSHFDNLVLKLHNFARFVWV
jgi:hypothetical protein